MKFIMCVCMSVMMAVGIFAFPTYTDRVLGEEVSSEYVLSVEEVYAGLNRPWGMIEYLHEDGTNTDVSKSTQHPTFIVTERNAKVWVMRGGVIKEVVGLFNDVLQYEKGGVGAPGWFDVEQGSQGVLYISYAKSLGRKSVLSLIKFTLDMSDMQSSSKHIEARQVEELFESNDPIVKQQHFGGSIAVHKKSNYDEIYLSVGDRQTRDRPQVKQKHTGDIVMIRSDTNYVKIISYGHRNQQGLYFDEERMLLYSTEHGPKGGDEVNIIEDGKNYGWPVISHGKEYVTNKQVGVGTHKKGMEQPMYFWPVSPAISGLLGYYGDEFPLWNGRLLVGALKFKTLFVLTVSDDGRRVVNVQDVLKKRYGRVRAIEQDSVGNIYILTDEFSGRMIRIREK